MVRWHSQNTNTYATAAYNRECQEITCSATKTWPVFLSDRKISIMRLRQNQFCISTDLWQTLLVVVVSMQYTTTSHPDVLHPVHVMARISSCVTTSIDENNWKINKESTDFVMHCVYRCTRPTTYLNWAAKTTKTCFLQSCGNHLYHWMFSTNTPGILSQLPGILSQLPGIQQMFPGIL